MPPLQLPPPPQIVMSLLFSIQKKQMKNIRRLYVEAAALPALLAAFSRGGNAATDLIAAVTSAKVAFLPAVHRIEKK